MTTPRGSVCGTPACQATPGASATIGVSTAKHVAKAPTTTESKPKTASPLRRSRNSSRARGSGTGASTGALSGKEIERDAEDHVDRQQHDSFHPVRFAVLGHERRGADGHHHARNLEEGEVQVDGRIADEVGDREQ